MTIIEVIEFAALKCVAILIECLLFNYAVNLINLLTLRYIVLANLLLDFGLRYALCKFEGFFSCSLLFFFLLLSNSFELLTAPRIWIVHGSSSTPTSVV